MGPQFGVSHDDVFVATTMDVPIVHYVSINAKPGSFADDVSSTQLASANEQHVMGDRSKTHVDLLSSSTHVPCVPSTTNGVALLGVPLNTLGYFDNLTKDIELGKLEVWSDLPSEKRTEVIETIWAMWDAFMAENPNSVDINTKSTSYAGAAGESAKDQPKVNSNFRPLVDDPVFDYVNICIPHKVVESLEAILEGGPWLIHNSLIILKKWSMDTRLLKEELTRIPIWVKLLDVPIQVFEEDEANLVDVVTVGIPSLTGDGFTNETIHVEYEWRPPRCDICKIFGHVHDNCPKKVTSPLIITTSTVFTPTVEKSNDGFQTMVKKKKRKCKSKSTNGGQFAGPSVKQTVRYEPKVTTSTPKKRTTNVGNASKLSSMLKATGTSSKKDNISTSNSFSALNDDEEDDEEDVENVYDESANLFPNTKTGGSLSFTDTAG
ncbi:zinc knuckle CX2CX4HX4C containing protein [Tanacetum coccineum]